MTDDCDDKKTAILQGSVEEVQFEVAEKDILGANDEALKIRLSLLEEEHRDLDAAIVALGTQKPLQSLTIARLKKKKLKLKDEVSRLRDIVEPDIIA